MPPQFKSKEAAQKEMEDLLSGAREQMAAFGQRVSEGAQQAASGAQEKMQQAREGASRAASRTEKGADDTPCNAEKSTETASTGVKKSIKEEGYSLRDLVTDIYGRVMHLFGPT